MSSSSTAIKLQLDVSYRQILKIAFPIAAALIVPQIQFITNNIFLGHLNERSLAVAGIAGVYYLIFAVVGLGLNNGLQALISRRAGENRLDEISKLFHHGVFVSFLITFIGIAFTYLLAPIIMRQVLHDQQNVEMAMGFLYIRIWGLPIMFIYQMRNALLIGINQSKFLIIGTAVESITNIVFDYGLIYGKLGMPALGFNGAAYASIIAEVAGLLATYGIMQKKGISRQLHLFKNIHFNFQQVKLVFNQSLPLMLQYAISITTWNFFYILIEHHGERDLALSNAMRNIFGLFGFITGSFGAASNTMVSNVIGQGMQDRVFPLIKMILTLSVGFALTVCLLLNIFPEAFLKIYGQDDEFIRAGVPVVRVVSTALVLASMAVVWLNSIVGTGNSRINLYIEIAGITLYSIFAYLTLEVFKLSIAIGWMAEWVFWITMLTPAYLYMKSGKWKGKKI